MATAFIRKVHKREMTVSSPPRTVPVSGRSQCLASFAQQRIWRDEKSYFDPVVSPAVFNICMPLKIRYGSMSIVRIRSAIIRIVEHYKILRTAVYFNEENGQLEQEVKAITKDDNYSFEITHNVRSLEQINALLTAESITHFAQVHLGLVVRCHLIKMTPDDVEYLQVGDLIVFTFHQIAIDMSCAGLFIDAFHQAYDLTESWPTTSLQYIDFTLYEAAQSIDPAEDSKWNRARRFWSKSLDGYDWNKDGLLSVDFATGKRMCSGQGNSSVFTLDYSLVDAQIQFVSSNSVSMFQLGLACYFVFLSKLHVDGITDLCVASSVYNRPLVEMTSMIGNVVNLLPFRIKIDPEKSFMYLIGQIRILCREVLEHGYLPYQQIISIGNNGSSTARNHFHFHCDLDASLHPYRTKMETKTKDATLEFDCDRDWSSVNGTAVNDLTLTVNHNSGEHTTQCILTGSTDQYNSAIMSMMARRFQQLLTKLFSSNTTNSKYDRAFDPIASLLSEEARRIEGVTTHRSPNGTNEVQYSIDLQPSNSECIDMRFVKERVYPGAHIAAGNPNEHFHHGIVIDPTAPDVSIIHFWGPTAVLTRLRSTTLPAFLAGGVSRIGNRSRRLYLVKYDGDTREKREGTVKVAQEMLAKDDIPFDYTTSNCENFACFCRTGKWESEQIKKIEDLLVVKASDNAMLSSESGLNSPDSASSYSQKP